MSSMGTFGIAAYGRHAGSSRVRLFDWFDHLGLTAIEKPYTSSTSFSTSMFIRQPSEVVQAEVRTRRLPAEVSGHRVVLSRRATPFSNGAVEASILRSAMIGVYDFDDSLASTPVEGAQRIWSVAKTWQSSVRAADRVIAGNEYLANQAEGLAKDVIVVPSCVQVKDYTVKHAYAIDRPVAVWIGSPSTEHYLQAIAPPLLRLNAELGLRLRVISGGARNLGPLEDMTDRVTWGRQTFADQLAGGDLGIMPLPDDEWTRGKCAYKLLQYGAAALPLVGSPVGANKLVLQRGAGYAPESIDDWYFSIKEILTSPQSSRETMGRTARQAVEAFYSFDAWEDRWKAAVGLG